jgi:hypothetical protein
VLILLLVAGVAAIFLDPTRFLLGHLRGENFFRNRPSSYWARALSDPAPGAKPNTMDLLSKGGAEAAPVLAELVRTGSSAEVRWSAAEVLGFIGPPAASAVPALADALRDSEPNVRYVAVKALIKFRATAHEAIPALVEALKDSEVRVRANAAEALGEMGATAREAVPAIAELLKDPEEEVRAHAAEALGDIGPVARPALPALRAALNDPSEEVRKEATQSIQKIATPPPAEVPGKP